MNRIFDLAIDALIWVIDLYPRKEDPWFVLALEEDDVP